MINTKLYTVAAGEDFPEQEALESLAPMIAHDERSLGKFVKAVKVEKEEYKGVYVIYTFNAYFQEE